MKRLVHEQETGFTLIELLIATTIFATIMLGASMILLQVGRMYNRAVVASRTQEVSRSIIDEISQAIQASGGKVYPEQGSAVSGTGGIQIKNICVGNVRYSFAFRSQVTDGVNYSGGEHKGPHAVWRDTIVGPMSANACHDNTPDLGRPNLTNGRELLAQNMRLSHFAVRQPDINNPLLYTVDVGVVSGDDDLLPNEDSDNPGQCENVRGNEWCATSLLQTSVVRRLSD